MEREPVAKPELKIVIPQNMRGLKNLLGMAGWQPFFERSSNNSRQTEQVLNKGVINNGTDKVIQLRSMDALRLVAAGRCDVGFVGNDCVQEKREWEVEILGKVPMGRALGAPQPRLEIIVPTNSTVWNMEDVRPGAIFFSERPQLTCRFLTENGLQPVIENGDDPALFREFLVKEGMVGIWIIQGGSPVQIEYDQDFGVIVNETGDTIDAYQLRVVSKIIDIETLIVGSRQAFDDPLKRNRISQFVSDVERTYQNIEGVKKILEGTMISGERQI